MIMHGDAAFAGQGIWAETLNMASLHGYNVGGTIQVITNNLLGFTAVPEESNSSRFATRSGEAAADSDLPCECGRPGCGGARGGAGGGVSAYVQVGCGGGPDRATGGMGTSEVDDPTVTQPRRYAIIKDHPPLSKIYAKKLGVDASAEVAAMQKEFLEDQKEATQGRAQAVDARSCRSTGTRITAARCMPTTIRRRASMRRRLTTLTKATDRGRRRVFIFIRR